jgi:hypothetical protein
MLDLPASKTWGRLDTLEDHFLPQAPTSVRRPPMTMPVRHRSSSSAPSGKGFRKNDADGTIRVYDPATSTFGAFNPNGTTRTFLMPERGADYWTDQPGTAPWGP